MTYRVTGPAQGLFATPEASSVMWFAIAPDALFEYGDPVSYSDIITIEPGKRGGKPCIRGLRITVYDVLEYLASGMTQADISARVSLSHGTGHTCVPRICR